MDRRVKYSRKMLNESLIRHLKEKPISRITVTELCKDADLNRSTYYAHFTDPFDQFAKLKSEIFQELTDYTAAIDAKRIPAGEKQYRILKAVLEYVDSRRDTFQVLLSMTGDYSLQYEILQILGEKAFHTEAMVLQKQDPVNDDYRLIYAANGCFGLFYRWLMVDSSVSVDQLAHMMADFTRKLANN